MKTLILISFLFAFPVGFACQKKTNDSTNSITSYATLPPVDLNAQAMSDSQVDLSCSDKSTNEDGFKMRTHQELKLRK
jgi:hypothetical protein